MIFNHFHSTESEPDPLFCSLCTDHIRQACYGGVSVYVISILENFSRMLLASAISERQDTAAFLRVFAQALRNYGAPEAIVTDGGGILHVS
jgi:hypothetical protein